MNARRTDLNVLEVPAFTDLMPVMFGHEQLVSMLRKHASYASDHAQRTSRQEPPLRVAHGAGTSDGVRDVGRPRMRMTRPRLEQRRGVAAPTVKAAKVTQHVRV